MTANRASRTWRGIAAAVFATFAASLSHSVANGTPAPALGVILALTLSVPVCIALAGRRFSWVRLSVAVALSQFAFHGLLLIGVGTDPSTGFTPSGAHVHGVAAIAATGTAVPHDHAGLAMWGAHAIAALITVLVFGKGEQALRRLLDLAGWRLVARLVAWRPAPVAVRLPAPAGRVFVPHPAELLSEVSRRGPPLPA
ncbi:hypothetical protein ABCS02_20825 [Microbacterium sp. X-17]|uniref:hypothetical protein n=1 Tax=Microbacterium sp. X-17 TaxID=3144404 RepID=UPI0031F55CC1